MIDPNLDWKQLKTEYITTGTSYRKLAAKYGIPTSTVFAHARKEDWVGLRKRSQDSIVSKTVAKIENQQASRAARVRSIADKLLDRLEGTVDRLDPVIEDIGTFRQITNTLKDLRDIHMIRSEADIREQEVRIKTLERQIEESGDTNVTVSFIPLAEKPSAEEMSR